MRLTLVTAAAAAPVELASAKHHCRVDHDDDDAMIQSFIDAATEHLDGPSGVYGRAIMPQTWLLETAGWSDSIVLPIEPVRSVVVTYKDAAGVEQTLDAANYQLSAWPRRATEFSFAADAVKPALSNDTYPVSFTIEAGYADAASVPAPLKTAILMLVAHWYQTREAVIVGTISGTTPLGFDALIAAAGRRLV